MAAVVIIALGLIVIWLLYTRNRSSRQKAVAVLKRNVRQSPVTGPGDIRAPMLSAVEFIPHIDASVARIHKNGIAACAQGITLMEVSAVYLYYAARFAQEHFPSSYDSFMPVLSGGIIDFAEHELHWPESSLQEFQTRIDQRPFEYYSLATEKRLLVQAFYAHINEYKEISEDRRELIASEFVTVQTNVANLLRKYA